jgi:hypothetical protein
MKLFLFQPIFSLRKYWVVPRNFRPPKLEFRAKKRQASESGSVKVERKKAVISLVLTKVEQVPRE